MVLALGHVVELLEDGLDLTLVPAGEQLTLGLLCQVLELDAIPVVAAHVSLRVLDGHVDGDGGWLLELEVRLDGLEIRGIDLVYHVYALDELAHSFLVHGEPPSLATYIL